MVLKKLVPRVMREDADYDGENLTSPQGREGGKIILKNVSHSGVRHAVPVPCVLVLTW